MKKLQNYSKAILGFLVAFVGALVSEVNTGTNLNQKTVLLALGTAVVTAYAVFQARNGS